MAAAAILDFFGIEISSQRTSRPACIYLHTKFGEATSTCSRVMAIMCFQNGGRPPSWIFRKWNLTSPEVAGCPYLPPDQIWWRYLKRRPSYGSLCVFKMATAAILNLLPVSIFSYRRFWIVALYVLAKLDKSTSLCGWVIEVCTKIQNGGCPPSWIIIWLSWTTHKVLLLTWSLCSNFVSIGFIFAKISPIEHFTSLA